MREIKFRAWHKGIKKMYKIGQITLEKGVWNYEPEDRGFIGMSKPYQPSFVLMQYTGLKDKNGKEIYEGDIVNQFNVDTIGIVKFKDGLFGIKSKGMFWHIHSKNTEVIGNIYENPELLED